MSCSFPEVSSFEMSSFVITFYNIIDLPLLTSFYPEENSLTRVPLLNITGSNIYSVLIRFSFSN